MYRYECVQGAVVGGIASLSIALWMLIGQILTKQANQPLPTSTENCEIHFNNETMAYQNLHANRTVIFNTTNDGSPRNEQLHRYKMKSSNGVTNIIHRCAVIWSIISANKMGATGCTHNLPPPPPPHKRN